MSNANKNTSTASPAAALTTSTTPQAKPLVAAGDVKVSAGNGAPTSSTPPSSTELPPEWGDDKGKIQYHIVIGKVETFPDVSKAEAFLNSPDAPLCTVIYGKTSLANEWHITTGTIRTFPSLVKAQKFLKETAGSEKFVMIRGRITVPEARVSLRR